MPPHTRTQLGSAALERGLQLLDRLVPPSRSVVLHSSPDLDDNIVSLVRALDDRWQGRVVLLAEHPARARHRAGALGLDVTVVGRRSLRGVRAYLRAAVLISTHGMFDVRPRGSRKHVVGLWHGEFGKLIGSFVGEGPRHFDWVPVSSELSRSVRSAEFALAPDHIHVVGSPRQQLLRPTSGGADRWGAGRHVVWAPTYRRASAGQVRSDGDAASLAEVADLANPALLAVLEKHDATLWYRPHPVAGEPPAGLGGPRVRSASNEDLERHGASFYELLADTACFVTDYSSLWIDFVLTGRPMVAFCPDLETYRRTRGLALEPHEAWFPGDVVTTTTAFVEALDSALEQPDRHGEDRDRARAVLHTSRVPDPSAAVWEHVAAWLDDKEVRR